MQDPLGTAHGSFGICEHTLGTAGLQHCKRTRMCTALRKIIMVACVMVRVMATSPKNYTGRIFSYKTQSLVLNLSVSIVTTKL
jgi:hypothetical protein